jgi:hypothetical protein
MLALTFCKIKSRHRLALLLRVWLFLEQCGINQSGSSIRAMRRRAGGFMDSPGVDSIGSAGSAAVRTLEAGRTHEKKAA